MLMQWKQEGITENESLKRHHRQGHQELLCHLPLKEAIKLYMGHSKYADYTRFCVACCYSCFCVMHSL
jgi:hypothetical protein